MDPALIDRGNLRNSDWANYSWNDSQINLMQNYSENSATANSSLLSPTGVKRVFLPYGKILLKMATTRTKATVKSFENEVNENCSITNNNWNNAYTNKQTTKQNTNDDVDLDDCVAYMH